jgi:cell division protein FtsQ
MSGILIGLGLVVRRSDWTISKPEQIQIQGNQYLSDQTVRSMLAISYPKPIVELAPEKLTALLIDRGSISSARVDRSLLPPQLIVQVEDLPPVARILQDENTPIPAFVDERGRQLPISSYRPTVWQSLPKLQLRLPTAGTCPEWTQLYQAIRTSPVTIGIIDCRNPQNLMLQTELGQVRLGVVGDSSRLASQIQQLDRLRNWQKGIDRANIDYLDLENPLAPGFKLKQPIVTTINPALIKK